MKQNIKYSYCVDENGKLVHISSLTDATRHARKLYCLQCGQEMVANLGQYKAKHFSHKADTACDGESYLHKLAKRRIKEKFDSSENFPVMFLHDVPCCEASKCPCYDSQYCALEKQDIRSDLKIWKNKPVYDTCEPEVPVGEFRPDLLLTCSTKPDRQPVFIEIFKTHESNEIKINSRYRIIETKQVKSEDDIEDIINRGFVEGDNCTTYNFKPQLPSFRKDNVPIDRFILFKTGSVIVHRALDYVVYCKDKNKRIDPRSVVELNMRDRGIDIWGVEEEANKLNSYQAGLVYLTKKGMNIRNCILCKYYKFNESYSKHFCILYKVNGIGIPCPKQNEAKKCPRFELNPTLMNHSLSELEKEISEVPNEGLLITNDV